MPSGDPTLALTIAGLARITEVALEQHGLTIQKYRVLAYLSWKEMSPSELADQLFVKPPVTSKIVYGLAERGFIVRTVDPGDRRRSVLALTASGTIVLRAANVAIHDGLQQVGSMLDADEQQAAYAGLGLWSEAMRRFLERSHDETLARRRPRA